MRHFIIDTDTASDDAVALIMALEHPEINIEAITVVCGNVPLPQAIQNALYTVELCGQQVPVYAGATQPLLRPLETAQFVHGEDGLGDIGLELNGRIAGERNAVDALIEISHQFPGEIEWVALGPLTNLAIALSKAPSIASKIKHLTVMGGVGQGPGNITPVSEYNIWVDPEAAQIVFKAGIPMTMVGWDIALQASMIMPEESIRLRDIGTAKAHFAIDIQNKQKNQEIDQRGMKGFTLPDPIAMAIAIDPSIARIERQLYVEVIASNGLTRGQTVVDHPGVCQKTPNVKVVLEADHEAFISQLSTALAS